MPKSLTRVQRSIGTPWNAGWTQEGRRLKELGMGW
jgi:hypothetical protein